MWTVLKNNASEKMPQGQTIIDQSVFSPWITVLANLADFYFLLRLHDMLHHTMAWLDALMEPM